MFQIKALIMKLFTCISLMLLITVPVFSQTNTDNDEEWNYTMEDADLVIEAKVTSRTHMSGQLLLSVLVNKVVKGNCKQAVKISFDLNLSESSRLRYDARFKAIEKNDLVTIGFKKEGYGNVVNIEGVDYGFFMSE